MRRPSLSPASSTLLFVITTVVLPLTTGVAGAAVPESIKPYLGLAWPVVGLSALVAVVLMFRRRPPVTADDDTGPAPATGGGGQGVQADDPRPARAADQLARILHDQWSVEAELRMLHRPLHVRWSSTHRPVTPDPETLLDPDTVGGRPLRLRLRGGIGHTAGIVPAFTRLHHKRLVILGEPGAGKTVVAILLTLGLLAHRREHDAAVPVPVLLSLSSWDPYAEHPHTWVARRMVDEYRALANTTAFGPDAARRLVTEGRVVPVLDGLDEMPPALHKAALDALDRLRPGAPLVVTCRGTEYEAAVAAGGTVLGSAAVVELEPVGVADVIAFLPSERTAGGERWAATVAHLRATPDGPLARALSSPLMASLARVVYTGPDTDPAELLDPSRFGDPAAIEDHLLDAFIPAVYTHRPAPPGNGPPRAAPRRYPPELAHKWLTSLATHLRMCETRDFTWWQLHGYLAPARRRILVLVLQLVAGLFAGLGLAPGVGFTTGMLTGLAGGFGSGLVFPVPTLFTQPGYANFRLRGRLRLLVRKLAQGLGMGLVCGAGAVLAVGLATELGAGFPWGLKAALAAGLGAGAGVGVGIGAMMWLHTPADTISAPSPTAVLRHDRIAGAARALVESFGSGLLTGVLVGGPGFGLTIGVTVGVAAGVGGGFAMGLAQRLVARRRLATDPGAWGWFTFTRVWLALRGRFPWRLMPFLHDAHRRGVLRQAGAVYQFRHARLQDRLAPPRE
ncbi:hypothetical protein LUZ28_18890 [Streptomyces albireticuli]|nr:hypothetical protein [Streptomyces albireticuli]MCD9141525.1 hypothetical protein [Streptomyces albireticuli]MCD9164224.1 hypothetical protein [Streptomyces albireticuli]